MCKIRQLALVLLLTLSFQAEAAQLTALSSEDGLSNNAILSIYQNNIGHIYIGTADGLNIWDGHSMKTFTASDGYNYFFGNMIWKIYPYKDNTLILHTNHGVASIDTRTKDVQFYDELALLSQMTVDSEGNFLTLRRDNALCYFDTSKRKTHVLSEHLISMGEVCHLMTMIDDERLCVFTDKDIYVISLTKEKDKTVFISEIANLKTKCRYVSPCHDKGESKYHMLISDNKICSFDIEECSISDISPISSIPDDVISGIIPTEEGYYISFLSKGIYFLPNGENSLKPTDIKIGVFSMLNDKNQAIIWIGSDCNGLIKYSKEPKPINCLTYNTFPFPIRMPVRSIHVDKERCLWFGTKGDGLFRIPDYGNGEEISFVGSQKLDTDNSSLNNNSVYALTEGNSGVLWIGTEGSGLNCWSYRTKRIEKVKGSEDLRMVHSIIEQNDSTLWIGSDTRGVYKCNFKYRSGSPIITKSEIIQFCEPFDEATRVFSMKMQDDSTLWVSSRGQGVLAYNMKTGKSRVIKLPTDYGFAINETFYIAKSDRMLFATGNGLMTYCPASKSVSISDIVPKKATHGIVCDKDKNIWVSTNSGIVSLDSLYNYRLTYDRFSGTEVLEYSDGACYFDEISDKVIFGGINGLTIINSKDAALSSRSTYTPDINITHFIQNDDYSHISSMMKKGRLELPYSKSIFGIEFSVVDHINYSNYEFMYNIEGYNSDWILNNGNIIYMQSLAPGQYKLKIVYVNKATQYRSEECILPIYISPPFYKTWGAYCFYLLSAALCILLIVRNYKRRYALAKEKIHKKYSEKISTIAQETTNTINESLSVQLTFIIGLCQQIRLSAQNNPHVADKVKLVEYNIAKISKTLHTFNEHKSITEALINAGKISFISINQTVSEVLEIIQASTETRNVKMTYNIAENITIALNKEAFLTMLYSLLYKVISTAKGEKTVDLHIDKSDSDKMAIKIVLSSDRKTYEDMYILTELADGTYTEGRYDIAFCRRLIMMMSGSMNISFSDESNDITIEICLPSQKVVQGSGSPDNNSSIQEGIDTYNTLIENLLPKNFKRESILDHIYVISNKRETSSFLGYFLSDSYNVSSYTDNSKVMERIGKQIPNAVIYDVSSMPDEFIDFIDFIDAIKSNRRMEQAIIIALTSSLQTAERELYIQLGADLCISFPFNMNYLRSALERLLQKKKNAEEYYKSPMSKFVINEGKVIHQADKEFIDKILHIIDQNISNPELTAMTIAEALGTSTRAMYRRLENITDNKLHQMIRETRMNFAVSLLSSSKLTIDEIMYKVGYDNRSTFYRSFKAIYGKTPKEYREDIHNNIVENFQTK